MPYRPRLLLGFFSILGIALFVSGPGSGSVFDNDDFDDCDGDFYICDDGDDYLI
jgi:hypothetical protein